MIVRKMRPEEIDVTVNLCKYYASEASELMPEIEEQFDTNSVINLVRGRTIQDSFFWFNAYEGTRPVGFVSGTMTTPQWNENIVYAHIDLIFVLKEHRNMQSFKQLINQVEEWGAIFDVQKITAGDIGIDVERSRKLYESIGFSEALWMYKDIKL
jgi:GNAT superfamily N-acetyltransferase|tara:strand:+ start:399 stop:863 length:465 start_codon:yes stop_codon:yes gene_type:complete